MKRSRFGALVLITLAVLGCGNKSSDKPGDAPTKGAAASGSPRAAAAGGVVATCVKGKTTCVEYKNTVPDLAEEICKGGPDYVWKPGSAPCPTDKLLGKCLVKSLPDEATYWYGGPEELDLDKGLCEAFGQWVAAGAPKAGASATATPTAAASSPSPKKKKK